MSNYEGLFVSEQMASSLSRKNKFQVVLVNGRNDHQDFFTRVLTSLVRISFKTEDGSVSPTSIMSYMARISQRSINDKDLRKKVGSALVRGMQNKLVTLKDGQFKLTKRARVVVDKNCRLWLKIPNFLPTQYGDERVCKSTSPMGNKKKNTKLAKIKQTMRKRS